MRFWFLDFATLVVVLATGLYVGLIGILGHALFTVDEVYLRGLYYVIGFSSIWQVSRQRFW